MSTSRADNQPRRWHRPLALACAAVLAGVGVALAAPANAASTATAMATTPRMFDPKPGAPQDGWYHVGEHLALVCSTQGRAVQGYFSFNTPGGWNSLWYKVSDGRYVADIDIETNTVDFAAPDCGSGPGQDQASPSAPTAVREDRAVDWATGAVGSDQYEFMCGKFVANAYGMPYLGAESALIFHDLLADTGQIHMDMNFPKGALVFSTSNWDLDRGVHQGHVVIARGDGTYVSGGVGARSGNHHTVQILNSWNPSPGAIFGGWAYAPGDWPGP